MDDTNNRRNATHMKQRKRRAIVYIYARLVTTACGQGVSTMGGYNRRISST